MKFQQGDIWYSKVLKVFVMIDEVTRPRMKITTLASGERYTECAYDGDFIRGSVLISRSSK